MEDGGREEVGREVWKRERDGRASKGGRKGCF